MMEQKESEIRIGTSGFSFPDWVGPVYPAGIKKPHMLEYYEIKLGFETLEVNFTYYSLPGERTMEAFVRKTSGDFDFVVKGYRGMTHDPFDTRLTKRPDKAEVKDNFKKFVSALGPLKRAKKLGAILLQFPVFFYPSTENKDYILKCKEWIGDIRTVIEFRNRSWAKKETFDFLRENNLAHCAVDEPKLPRLMPFVNEVTSNTAYFRLHGRNTKWFNVSAQKRYNYLYTDTELKGFVPEILHMKQAAVDKLYIFFNNCHAGAAVKNAQRMKKILEQLSILPK